EKLAFTRWFEGHEGDKRYFEILQKFAHIFDLHYIEHKKAYCRLDENGDLESVVRIFSLAESASVRGGAVIVVARRVLDEYLLMSEAVAVRTFDFTRLDVNTFRGWGGNRNESKHEDGVLGYRLTIQSGVGSYLRGAQLARPIETMGQFHYRLTHANEVREYASFIAFDWKNGVVKEISCAPGATANYFTKSALPYEITPAFFRAEVLSKYKLDPKKYKLEHRSIDCRGSWRLKTFDINEEGQVHSYLVYLRDLPYSEQLYWKSFNEVPKGTISKRAFETDIEGDFHTDYYPLESVQSFVRKLAKHNVGWWKLRADDLLSKVHYPVTQSNEEWANEIMALDKLLVEGLELRWLKTKASELGQSPQAQDQSLALTERCLRGLGFDEEAAKNAIMPLRTLHHLKSKLKGHATGMEAEGLRKEALNKYGTYRRHFEKLCSDCDEAFRAVAEAFRSFGEEVDDNGARSRPP
ncbi:MAG TPA: hypothetical protein VIE65_19435, partial [Methylobacter sp.]